MKEADSRACIFQLYFYDLRSLAKRVATDAQYLTFDLAGKGFADVGTRHDRAFAVTGFERDLHSGRFHDCALPCRLIRYPGEIFH
ncbi:hypothetical protein AEQ63_08175 [Pseudomonas sp. RIT-PI-o]|nr:hypothetical protein AEQ63_08175 [Pseudomonas sp. RIT-PI-o]